MNRTAGAALPRAHGVAFRTRSRSPTAISSLGCGQAPPIPVLPARPAPHQNCKTAENGRGPLQRWKQPRARHRIANGSDVTESALLGRENFQIMGTSGGRAAEQWSLAGALNG